MTKTSRKTVNFEHAFTLKGIDHALPAGSYEIVSDDELIESLSFPVYRRVSTFLMVPIRGNAPGEMYAVGADDLAAALERDKGTRQA